MAEINYQLPLVTIYGEKPSLWNNILRGFRNATLGAAMADTPSVMTASGWRLNEKGDYVQDKQDDEGVSRLRENLADISMMSPTHPVTAVVDKTLPYVIKGGNYLWNQGLIQAGKRGNLWAVNKAVSNAFNKAYKGTYNILEPLSTTIVSGSRPIQVGESYIRINPTWTWANEAIDVYPKGKPNQFFLLIKDNKSPGLTPNPNGEYSVHFKTTRTGITPQEKEGMFKALEEQIPEGAKVSTWGTLTPGGYHGVNRFGNLFGYPRVGTRQADIPIYLKPFKSELDWSPKSWFGGAAKRTSWTPEDEAILASHVPEYNQIELTAKANGTWLKMPDDSTWEGDPRSWVQLMSKDGNKLVMQDYKSGVTEKLKQGIEDYNGDAWTTYGNSSKIAAPLYAGENGTIVHLSYPKSSKLLRLDAKGRGADDLPYKWDLTSYEKSNNKFDFNFDQMSYTDDAVQVSKDLGNDVTFIDNVVDAYDKNKNYIPIDEMIIHKGTPRKSLLGNNGNFDLRNKNIYRVGIPTLFGGTYLKNQNNDRQ